MKLNQFKGDYNKSEFYTLMGKFFAERNYKRIMPYLVNDENSTWYVAVEKGNVLGFINYVEKLGRVNIGYCFIDEMYKNRHLLEHNLLAIVNNECILKDMFVEVEKSWDKDGYLKLGFEIYKETTNYWYLVKKVKHEDL